MEHAASSHISLAGKVAIVTGAARGIGRATALVLARAGAGVLATDIADGTHALRDTVSEMLAEGMRIVPFEADLRHKSKVCDIAEATLREYGRIDILVNVAGIHRYDTPLATVSEDEWDAIIDTNLKGSLFACQAVLSAMRTQGCGAIVNVASDSAFDVIPGEGPYGISKIGVVRMSSYLAKELAGTGIRVNSVAPGWVRTRLTEFVWQDSELEREAVKGIPAGRIASPAEIASVVLFLVSDLASYVNGHCIVADGGRIAGVPA